MRLLLAPMEGVLDFQLRHILTSGSAFDSQSGDKFNSNGGIDSCVTEFLRVIDQEFPNKVFRRLCPELEQNSRTLAGVPVSLQLLGGQADAMAANAARAARLGAHAIDLNFGCPAKTVNKNDGGAKLLKEPDRIHAIVKAVRQAVPMTTPVTAKIRLGFEDRSAGLCIALAIAEAGADQIVVHARSKVDAYRPPAYWREIRPISDALKIPVVANGDIWSVDDAKRCQDESGCSDLMLGRGMLARPDLALALKNPNHQEWHWEKILKLLYEFFCFGADHYPEKFSGNRVKQWLNYLQRYYLEAEVFFQQIKSLRRSSDIRALFMTQLYP